jgi:hypothetical protein
MSSGPLSFLDRLTTNRSRRIANDPRASELELQLMPGEKRVLAEISGPGVIKHLWLTSESADAYHRRSCVIRMFWDGSDIPSVEVPVGDFFGQGWGMQYNFASLPLAAAPKSGAGLVCYFPMPFSHGARIEIENQGFQPVHSLYHSVTYEMHPEVDHERGRFHAAYSQRLSRPSDVDNLYLFADIRGGGHFVGLNYFVNAPTPLWYGNADDVFLVDEEPWSGSERGTGIEDYFNIAWGADEAFMHPYFGIAHAPREPAHRALAHAGRAHCYRFHIDDPIRFEKSLTAGIRHGDDHCLTYEIASVAYWYQREIADHRVALPSAKERQPRTITELMPDSVRLR